MQHLIYLTSLRDILTENILVYKKYSQKKEMAIRM